MRTHRTPEEYQEIVERKQRAKRLVDFLFDRKTSWFLGIEKKVPKTFEFDELAKKALSEGIVNKEDLDPTRYSQEEIEISVINKIHAELILYIDYDGRKRPIPRREYGLGKGRYSFIYGRGFS